ncbi:hypothetical protein DPMN_092398 [Dreissena polymorpha]|uniref:Uncharacterized protein n=1 Tax=Dreissena polymorpha TaxID=45954 RepID=A0A9D4L275_DREPO|nr:hypothetical protein DPMN_092398 [Dreissena polymorpha]
MGGNGGQYGPVSVPSATLSPEAMALRRPYWTFGMRGPSGRRSLPSFVAIRHLLREIIATSGSYYGVRGQYGPVSVPSATLSPECDGTETPYWTFGMRDPSGQEVCQVSSLSDTFSER